MEDINPWSLPSANFDSGFGSAYKTMPSPILSMNFPIRHAKRTRNPAKVYLVDTGPAKRVTFEGTGSLIFWWA